MISHDVCVRVSVHRGGFAFACPFLGGQPAELRGEVIGRNVLCVVQVHRTRKG